MYQSSLGDRFSIKIDEKMDWKISNEKQIIDNLTCIKAELNYSGRQWVAWYTEEIPIPEGPYIFYGLPGLIIKITDKELHYDFLLKELKPLSNIEILTTSKEIPTNWDHFQKLISNYYNTPFFDSEASGIPIIITDKNGDISNLNQIKIIKQNQENMKTNGSNIIEIDKFPKKLGIIKPR